MHEHEPSAAPHAQPGAAAPHVHSHAHTRAVVNRLSRAIGHLEAVRRMVENGQDCAEVLIQLAAVRSALTSTGKLICRITWSTASWTPSSGATASRWTS